MQELRKMIDAQRKGKENSPVWMVGQQLLDIAAGEPKIIELLKHDLEIPEMDLVHAEKQIKAWADKNKKGNCCCVSPMVADGILRKFYGLPELQHGQSLSRSAPAPFTQGSRETESAEDGYIDITSIL